MLRDAACTRQRLVLPVAAVLLFLATACGEATSPFSRESVYVARAVDDAALPAPIIQHAPSERILLADTLRFTIWGVAKHISVHRDTVAGAQARIDTSRYAERFVIYGDSIRFLRSCSPDAICLGLLVGPVGAFSPDRQRLVLQLWYSGPVITYERWSP